MEDPELVCFDHDPKRGSVPPGSSVSHPAAGSVLVVIAYRDLDGDLPGINAWPATGQDLAIYGKGTEHGQDD